MTEMSAKEKKKGKVQVQIKAQLLLRGRKELLAWKRWEMYHISFNTWIMSSHPPLKPKAVYCPMADELGAMPSWEMGYRWIESLRIGAKSTQNEGFEMMVAISFRTYHKSFIQINNTAILNVSTLACKSLTRASHIGCLHRYSDSFNWMLPQ